MSDRKMFDRRVVRYPIEKRDGVWRLLNQKKRVLSWHRTLTGVLSARAQKIEEDMLHGRA
jgi:hypothetical protein